MLRSNGDDCELTADKTDGSEEIVVFTEEIQQLISSVTKMFSSKKEIFLRELISNAASALNKITMSMTEPEKLDANMDIKVVADKAANTLTIQDKGIGMLRTELI